MLDVHPPHESVHTWKDFLIHIATIVVGLIIAVCLEQTVEYFHHRHQLVEVRRDLAEERDLNRKLLERNQVMSHQMEDELNADLQLLEHRESGDRTPLAGSLHYDWLTYATANGVWQGATQSSLLSLMQEPELRLYAYRYNVLAGYMQTLTSLNEMMEHAGAIARSVPAGNFSAVDTHDLISATRLAQGQLAFSEKLLFFASNYGLKDDTDYSFLDRPPTPLHPDK